MKISVWKAIGMAGLLADELTKATSNDGVIDLKESLTIAKDLALQAGLQFDDKGTGVVVNFVTSFIEATKDGKITIAEIIAMAETVCNELGIEFDKTGFQV